MEVCKKIAHKQASSACATESPAANSTNQEHYQGDSAQDFDSDDDVIVETTFHKNDEDTLAREHENCTLWIKQPVDWTRFLTDAYSNSNNEDLKK